MNKINEVMKYFAKLMRTQRIFNETSRLCYTKNFSAKKEGESLENGE